jgi:potassium voltage-gated channel Eag-related subfamily H protein 7
MPLSPQTIVPADKLREDSLEAGDGDAAAIRVETHRSSMVDMDAAQVPSGSAYSAYPITAARWYIVDPRTVMHERWDILIAVLLIFTAYVTPFEVTFLKPKVDGLFIINRFVDFCFVVDMIKSFFTSYFNVEEQYWVTDLRPIVKNYARTWFPIDFLSILPFDSLGEAAGSDDMSNMKAVRTIRLLRLLKLLRLIRGMRIFDRYQDKVRLTYASKSLIKFFILLITVVHWMACALRLLPDLIEYTDPSNGEPVNWMLVSLGGQPVIDGSASRQYALAMYWSSMTLTTIGYGDVSATNDAEAVFMSFCMLVASALYAYSIGEVTNIVTAMDEPANDHNKDSDTLQHFSAESQFGEELTVRLRQYFRRARPIHRWQFYKDLLKKMSPALQGEVTLAMNGKYMANVPFFRINDEAERNRFLSLMTTQMVTKLFNAQEVILRKGDTMKAMFLVKSGTAFGCKGVFKIFSIGTWFGTDACLITGKYAFEVRSLNFLIVEQVTKHLLDSILGGGDFPESWALVRKHAVKAAFKQNFLRYIDLQKMGWKEFDVRGKDQKKHEQGALFSTSPMTRREMYYIMHGVHLRSQSEEDHFIAGKTPLAEKMDALSSKIDTKIDALDTKVEQRLAGMQASIANMSTLLSELLHGGKPIAIEA